MEMVLQEKDVEENVNKEVNQEDIKIGDFVQNGELDKSQNRRIEALEKRLSQVEIQLAGLITQISTLEKIGKGIIVLAGTALGVDIIPMLNGA